MPSPRWLVDVISSPSAGERSETRRQAISSDPLILHVERSSSDRQPVPRFALSVPTGEGESTSIARAWRPGEAIHCRLCPSRRCTAHDDYCLINVPMPVDEAEAPLFSSVGLNW